MKGKVKDLEFIGEFISKCIEKNINSSDDILKLAKDKLSIIDNKMKEIDKIKRLRPKLLDVIETFEKSIKNNKEEIKKLSFFNVKNIEVCKFICNKLNSKIININELYDNKINKYDINFCIKELIENEIIIKTENFIIKGSMFDDYCVFLKDFK